MSDWVGHLIQRVAVIIEVGHDSPIAELLEATYIHCLSS